MDEISQQIGYDTREIEVQQALMDMYESKEISYETWTLIRGRLKK